MQISRLTLSALGTCALIAVLAGCNSAGSQQLAPADPMEQNAVASGASMGATKAAANSASHPRSARVHLYVTNFSNNSVTVYAAGANGNVTPIRTISGSNTALYYPQGIALDADKATYVANGLAGVNNSLTVYAAGANGNVTPIRTISGLNTRLVDPDGIALGADGTTYVVSTGVPEVNVYAAGANGNVAPIRYFDSTGLSYPSGIALDSSSEAYVLSRYHCVRGHCSGTDQVIVYAAGADGNVTPIRTISGSHTGLKIPCGIALDSDNNTYVTNGGGNSLTVYAAGANGNVTPIRTISGSNTGLNYPCGIALDSDNNTYVTNFPNNSVTVYAAGANGNVDPIRTIHGSRTGLAAPFGDAIR